MSGRRIGHWPMATGQDNNGWPASASGLLPRSLPVPPSLWLTMMGIIFANKFWWPDEQMGRRGGQGKGTLYCLSNRWHFSMLKLHSIDLWQSASVNHWAMYVLAWLSRMVGHNCTFAKSSKDSRRKLLSKQDVLCACATAFGNNTYKSEKLKAKQCICYAKPLMLSLDRKCWMQEGPPLDADADADDKMILQ